MKFNQREKKNKMRLIKNFKKKNDMKELNKKDNVEMFSTKIRGGKAFAVEHKIRELKKRISKLLLIKSKKEN